MIRNGFALLSSSLLVSVPFVVSYHPYPYPTAIQEGMAGVLLLTSFALVRKEKRATPIFWFALLFAVYVVCLTLLLPNLSYPNRGYLFASYVSLFAVAVLTGQNLKDQGEAIAWLSAAIIIASLLNVTASPSGLLAQRNQYGDYLTLALISALYLYETNKIAATTLTVLSAILLVAINVSGCRGAVVYLFALLLFRRNLVTVAWLAGLVASTFVMQAGTSSSAVARLTVSSVASETMRQWLAREALTSWYSSPSSLWFGIGAGEFFAPTGIAEWIADHAHNLFLQLLAETGIVGTLIVLVGLSFWARIFLGAKHTEEFWWIASCFVVLFLHSQWEYPLWYLFFLTLFGIIIGLGATHDHNR